ncbi:unnamed protein product [Onchocerca flexuosa]|uniref:Uncharacterized protein n=1 Tax=Onchocerca flexuosa TaxID=387005 RepID=A0A183H2L5_9BILA|nr:unnamed protein product [Onchocerca flexuosa]
MALSDDEEFPVASSICLAKSDLSRTICVEQINLKGIIYQVNNYCHDAKSSFAAESVERE